MAERKWSRWYLVSEQNNPRIKRYRTTAEGRKTWQRYPAKSYKNLPESELESLLRRLNATYEIDKKASEERYNFDHAYINASAIERFEKYLTGRAESDRHIGNVIHMLRRFVFEFFIIKEKLPDPSRWHLREDSWGDWLLTQNLGPRAIRQVVSTANRFNKFLLKKVYPNMEAPRHLEPIGKVTFDKLMEKRGQRARFVTDETFELILKYAETKCPDVIPNIKLCRAFGLRISESLGLTKEKFLRESLLVNEQGARVKDGEIVRKKVKTKDFRKIPYWNMTAKEAWSLVQQVKVMHPTTLIKKVNECLAQYGHTSHDFRRAFITTAFRHAHWKDVQHAAGHKDIKTTLGYNLDDRGFGDEKADLD